MFDAPGPAVRTTIEQGGWGGMLWPGHPEWAAPATLTPDDVRAGTVLLSLALHYFTRRHPEADALQVCTAAQVLVSHAVAFLDQRAHLNRKVRFGVGRYDRPSHASIMPAPPLQ